MGMRAQYKPCFSDEHRCKNFSKILPIRNQEHIENNSCHDHYRDAMIFHYTQINNSKFKAALSRFNDRTHRIFSTNWENGFAEFTILRIKVLKKLQIRSSISQSNKGFITYKKKRVTTTTTILNRERLIPLFLKSEMRQGCLFILLPFSIQFKILLRVIRPESDFVTYVWFHGFLHPWQKPS